MLLKDHNAVMPVRLEPAASRSRVKHSTTESLRSSWKVCLNVLHKLNFFFFLLFSEVEETGLSLALLETPKRGFVVSMPI